MTDTAKPTTPATPGNRHHIQLGRAGEEYAAEFFAHQGAGILARNVSYPVGELDLIVQEADGTIVFVEVKTRSTLAFGGAESVTLGKRNRMRRAAARWLAGQPATRGATIRFDVVLLVGFGGSDFTVTHYEGIFDGTR